LKPHHSEHGSAARTDSSKRAVDGAGKRVLIAQSDRVLGEMYRDALEPDGWQVEICNDGQSAWSRILESPPDVLLLNTLPDVPVISFVERLRAHGPTHDLAVIVLIDSVDHLDLRRAQELGVLAWLTKSRITREKLSETLNTILSERDKGPAASRPTQDEGPSGP
jgi:two-component system, OmpR family, phosphate regulon response regulator PhoB